MLEQICVEEFEHKAVMLSEVTLVQHSDDVVLVQWVLLHDVVQILGLLVGELVIHLSIPSDLNSINGLLWVLMVFALHNLCKGTLSKYPHNFIPISNMLSNLDLKVALKVIKDGIALVLTI